MPKSSLIIPVYNEEKTILGVTLAALETSIEEIIITNDGSKDKTGDILREIGDNKRLQIINHPFRLGPGASRRTGISFAQAPVIGCFDADIRNVTPKMIESLFRPIFKGNADFVIANTKNGGRLSRNFAKPLISKFMPDLAFIERPLCGLFASRKSFLFPQRIEPEHAMLGILLDAYYARARITQINLGNIYHRRRHWSELVPRIKTEWSALAKRIPYSERNLHKLYDFLLTYSSHAQKEYTN